MVPHNPPFAIEMAASLARPYDDSFGKAFPEISRQVCLSALRIQSCIKDYRTYVCDITNENAVNLSPMNGTWNALIIFLILFHETKLFFCFFFNCNLFDE